AAKAVAEVAEDYGADHAGDVGRGERSEGQHGADDGVEAGEEDLVEDEGGRCAEDEQVVPFDGGSDHAGQGDLAHLGEVQPGRRGGGGVYRLSHLCSPEGV